MKFLVLIVLLLSNTTAYARDFNDAYYHQRYGLKDAYQKSVDNQGEGNEALYGVRNFREVLRGVLYRGGANNAFNRKHKRDNSNPLPIEGLEDLCKEGFTTSVYLYEKNFSKAPTQVSCKSVRGDNTLTYFQLTYDSKQRELLEIIHRAILDSTKGPVYMHCWNGWHASGYIAAIALRQFCGISSEAAVQYWRRNTDGNDGKGFDKVRKAVADFQPRPDLTIDTATQQRICPSL